MGLLLHPASGDQDTPLLQTFPRTHCGTTEDALCSAAPCSTGSVPRPARVNTQLNKRLFGGGPAASGGKRR